MSQTPPTITGPIFLTSTGLGLEDYLDEATGHPLEGIGPIPNISIFVGANNSGKSRLLRKVHATRALTILPETYSNSLATLRRNLQRLTHPSFGNLTTTWKGGGGDRHTCSQEHIQQLLEHASRPKPPSFWQRVIEQKDPQTKGAVRLLHLAAHARKPGSSIAMHAVRTEEGLPIDVDPAAYTALEHLRAEKAILTQTLRRIYVPPLRSASSLFQSKDERVEKNIFKTSTEVNYYLPGPALFRTSLQV